MALAPAPIVLSEITHTITITAILLYMTEALASDLNKEIDRYREVMKPAIILIPGISGNTGAGIAGVKKSVEQAVGSDILFNEE